MKPIRIPLSLLSSFYDYPGENLGFTHIHFYVYAFAMYTRVSSLYATHLCTRYPFILSILFYNTSCYHSSVTYYNVL